MKDLFPPIVIAGRLYRIFDYNTPKNIYRMERLSDFAVSIGKTIDDVADSFSMYMAVLLIASVRRYIQKQRLGRISMKTKYPSLSERYKKTKVPKHRDYFWINTGFLLNHIRPYRGGRKGYIYVGAPSRIRHPENGIILNKIIIYLERGTKYVPARPLFTPTFQLLKKNIDSIVDRFMRDVRAGKWVL